MMRNFFPIRWIASAIRDVWQIIGISLLLVVLGHYILGGAGQLRDRLTKGPDQSSKSSIDPRIHAPVYDEFPDIEKFWIEQKKGKRGANFQPYYHWRRGGFVGKYTNTSPEGVRLTIKNDISPNAVKIFMFVCIWC